jgi:hypothetical protein
MPGGCRREAAGACGSVGGVRAGFTLWRSGGVHRVGCWGRSSGSRGLRPLAPPAGGVASPAAPRKSGRLGGVHVGVAQRGLRVAVGLRDCERRLGVWLLVMLGGPWGWVRRRRSSMPGMARSGSAQQGPASRMQMDLDAAWLVVRSEAALRRTERVEALDQGFSPDRRFVLFEGGVARHLLRLGEASRAGRRRGEYEVAASARLPGLALSMPPGFGEDRLLDRRRER